MELTPKYVHDCDACVMVGQLTFRSEVTDVYTCGDTIVLRKSDDPPDYSSISSYLEAELVERSLGRHILTRMQLQ